MTVLDVDDLRVDLRPGVNGAVIRAVRGVSFTLEPGRRLGIVGESGCGKTTTLMAVAGLLAPTATVAGQVRVCGKDQFSREHDPTALRMRDVGFVFQGSMNALNPVKRIGHQLREALRSDVRNDRALARKRCEELLERVRLTPDRIVRAYPHQLSGGMRQRVCIAIALAGQPRLLLADEPTTALDTVVQARIIELLDELCRDLELSVVIVSHDLRLAVDFCDAVAIMYAGRIVEYGRTSELASKPQHPYTRLLFAATPTIESTADQVASIPGTPPDLQRAIEGCPFLPRCPDSALVCRSSPPPVATASGYARCHFAGA